MPGPACYDHDYGDLVTAERGPSEIDPDDSQPTEDEDGGGDDGD